MRPQMTAMLFSMLAAAQAEAKGTAETVGDFLGSLIQAASGDSTAQPAQPVQQFQPATSAEAQEKRRIAEEKAIMAQKALEQASQAKLAYELALEKVKLAQGSPRESEKAAAAEEARENYELAQRLSEKYASEAKIAALEAQLAAQQYPAVMGQQSLAYAQTGLQQPADVMPAPAYENRPMGLDLQLGGGFFVGAMDTKGISGQLHLGYRGSIVGIYAVPYILGNLGAHFDQLFGSLLETHLFFVNSNPLSLSLILGGGVGYFSAAGADDESWAEFAPVLKGGLEIDIKIAGSPLYIPIAFEGLGYVGTGHLVPFGFFNAHTGIGFLF